MRLRDIQPLEMFYILQERTASATGFNGRACDALLQKNSHMTCLLAQERLAGANTRPEQT